MRWTKKDVDAANSKRGARHASRRPGKFRNEITEYDGNRFASLKERDDYIVLKARQDAGEISGLELQRPFALTVNDILICTYVADAVYYEGNVRVVQDSKGVRTPVFSIKCKLMLAVLGIKIREV